MSWTTTKKFEYAAGNQKVQSWFLESDSATLELNTGLGVIEGVSATPASAASSPFSVKANSTSGTTTVNGQVAITGVTSGDDIYLTVWGR